MTGNFFLVQCVSKYAFAGYKSMSGNYKCPNSLYFFFILGSTLLGTSQHTFPAVAQLRYVDHSGSPTFVVWLTTRYENSACTHAPTTVTGSRGTRYAHDASDPVSLGPNSGGLYSPATLAS